MKSIGIDVGSFSIKYAISEKTSDSYRIIDSGEILLNLDPTVDSRINVHEILATISKQFITQDIRVVCSLPQQFISVRKKIFPFKERLKILDALPFELEEDIPFDQDDTLYDARIGHFKGNFSELLAFATPKRCVTERIEFYKSCYIDPDVLTSESAALSNLFSRWNEPIPSFPAEEKVDKFTEEGFAIIYFGHRRTLLLVFKGDELLTTRNFFFGGNDIARKIQRDFGIPFHEALKNLIENGFVLTSDEGATTDQIHFSNIIKESFDPFCIELKIAILEIQGNLNLNITSVQYMGGLSHLKQLGAYLTQKSEIATNPSWNLPYDNINLNSGHFSRLPIALGLSIEGLRKPRNPILNFRQKEFGKQNQTFNNFWEKWKPQVQIATACFLIFTFFGYLRVPISQSLSEAIVERLKKEAALSKYNLDKNQRSTGKIKSFINDKERILSDIKAMEQMQGLTSALEILKRISQTIPKNIFSVDIRNFKVNHEEITLEGQIDNPQMLEKLQNNIKSIAKNQKFSNFKTDVTPEQGKTAFGIKFLMERMNKNE